MAKSKKQKNLFGHSSDERSRHTNRSSNLKCILNEDDEKYYCYKKVQGRWVQCNGLPYDTEEECTKALQNF